MSPMRPTEEEEFDPQAAVLAEISDWAKMGEADAMRERYGKPPRPMPPGELGGEPAMGDPMGEPGAEEPEATDGIPGVEATEDGEAPLEEEPVAINGDLQQQIDPETLKAIIAAMGG